MSTNSDPSRIRFWKDQEGSCPLCERPILGPLSKSECNIDHIVPRSHGGSDARSNLQLAYVSCNSGKGCGCPSGDIFHLKVTTAQRTWRAQGFKCAICQEPIMPSDLGSPKKVRLAAGVMAHVSCLVKLQSKV